MNVNVGKWTNGGRWLVAGLGVVLCAWTTSAWQQERQTRTFDHGAGLMIVQIKSGATADFEMVMGKVKEALKASDDPVQQQIARSWKLYRQVEPGANGNVVYIQVISDAPKGGDYTVGNILADAFPAEVGDLYKRFADSFASGISAANLQLVNDFGQ